ncbi:MAG: molybdopterin converting factor subunit 1 [Ahrensia sp.]|nr:molybdopterin converting factor subunit 1 [Ahrensia sp.]
MTKLIYFAWVRERIGVSDEVVTLPHNIKTGDDLMAWLKTRGENYEYALENSDAIRIAVNQEHIHHKDALGDISAAEIALFPPMTGG